MKFTKFAAAIAAASLISAPVTAQAVQSLTPAVERTGAVDENGEKLEGSTGIIIGVLAAAAVIAGIIIIADDDDDPTSP
ncbi:hypothetical protein [Parasphingorhabdus sp.]|uniref:hypothetical protein n=1 Tax=Parasphingorhabdus sp. TaxID=2709688 RepID=UPI003265B044